MTAIDTIEFFTLMYTNRGRFDLETKVSFSSSLSVFHMLGFLNEHDGHISTHANHEYSAYRIYPLHTIPSYFRDEATQVP